MRTVMIRLFYVWYQSMGGNHGQAMYRRLYQKAADALPARAAPYTADGMQGNVTEYNAMDVMFGTELPHMGLMGHATSAFVDPGLDYTLGYSQVQLYIQAREFAC